jgi:hypothetical protein
MWLVLMTPPSASIRGIAPTCHSCTGTSMRPRLLNVSYENLPSGLLGYPLWGEGDGVPKLFQSVDMVAFDARGIELVKVIGS